MEESLTERKNKRRPSADRKRLIMVIAAIVLVVLAAALAGAGVAMASYSMRIQRQTLDEARAWQAAHYDISWYDALEKRDYTVNSYDGYALHVQFLQNPAPDGRYVIISHGYTDNRYGALKYAKLYLDMGFNVIVYDLRGHGENEETFCTYSARERRDLKALIDDTRARYADVRALGLHGESLGAATSIAVLDGKPPVDFVVADCGFSEIASVLKGGLKSMNRPEWLVNVASLGAKLRYGFSFSEMRPIDSLKNNEIPILFIHGAQDAFIPPAHSEAMKAATKGYSELRLVDGAGHAASRLTDPEKYAGYVASFLGAIGL